MQTHDIEIEVVYNGLLAKLWLNKGESEQQVETFIFKDMNQFKDWFNKNLSSPKSAKEFIKGLYKLRNKNAHIKDIWTYGDNLTYTYTGTGATGPV